MPHRCEVFGASQLVGGPDVDPGEIIYFSWLENSLASLFRRAGGGGRGEVGLVVYAYTDPFK